MSLSSPHEQVFKSTLVKYDHEEIQSESDDEAQSQNKLNTYRTIMTKGKNIFFKFNNSHLLFIKSTSFFRICDLARLRPEENILFSLYLTENSLEQYKQSFNAPPSSISTFNMKYHFKQSTLDSIKKETSIATQPLLYQKIWKYLYYILLVISLLYIMGVITYYVKNNAVSLHLIEINAFVVSVLGFIVCGMGLNKFYKKKVSDVVYENVLLVLMLCFAVGMIVSCEMAKGKECKWIGNEMISFYKEYYACFYICCLLCGGCGISLIWFNVKIVDFYRKYNAELKNNGIMLEDISDDEKK